MAFYSQDKIDDVNEAADLVALVSSYVNLKRVGELYKGLCPFHSEKTPSFIVTPHRHTFHCFGCGVGGGPIRFLMMIAGYSFPEAVEELASRSGISLPQEDARNGPPIARENRAALFEVLSRARTFFEENLKASSGNAARQYLADRGIEPRVAKEFGLGLAPSGWDGLLNHLRKEHFSEKTLHEAGLIKAGRQAEKYYDTFRDRLMVPILNIDSKVAGFGGRALKEDDGPKYLNSPETPVYKKDQLLYGFNRARPFLRASGLVFVVEGYFDLISLVSGGLNEVVAPLGTALTARQLNLLRGQVHEVMLVFDSDEAGQRATAKSLPLLLNAELDGRVLQLPQGHDPDTFIREFGSEAIYELASQSLDIIDFQVAWLKKKHTDTPAGQARMAREARELVERVPDSAKSQLLRRRLARLLGLDEELLGEFRKTSDAPGRILVHTQSSAEGESQDPSYDPMAGQLLKFILIHPESASVVLQEMAAYWPDDISKMLFDHLRKKQAETGLIDPGGAGDHSPSLASLVAEASVSPRQYTPQESGEQALGYMERIKVKWRKTKQKQLSTEIRKAQEHGDSETLLRLMEEKNSL